MIVRVLRARLKPGKRAAYERLVREHAIPVMRAAPGLAVLHVGQPLPHRPDEFVFVSVWTDLDSLKAFAGDTWEQVLILPGEADLVEEMSVQHYDDRYQSLSDLWSVLGDAAREREVAAQQSLRLTDAQWEHLRPLLPPPAAEGRPRADDRRTLDGILYVLRTGCRWQDIPPELGNPVTCWRRLTQWEDDGVWDRLWPAYLDTLDAQARLVWAQALFRGAFLPTRRQSRRARPAGDVAS
jgi:transposase/quinol monooxygenase YgiN